MTWTPPRTDEDPVAQPCRTRFVTRPGTIHGVRWAAANDAELTSGKQFILAMADQHTRSLGVMNPAESVRTSHSSAACGAVTSFAYHRALLSIAKLAGGGKVGRVEEHRPYALALGSRVLISGDSDSNNLPVTL